MIEEFTKLWPEAEKKLTEQYQKEAPGGYNGIFKDLITALRTSTEDNYGFPDPDRIETVDYGDYQGTRVFIVAGGGYQPWEHWACAVSYGSCSGCDTFQAIDDYGNAPLDERVKDYVQLALHMLQSLTRI